VERDGGMIDAASLAGLTLRDLWTVYCDACKGGDDAAATALLACAELRSRGYVLVEAEPS